MSPQSERILDKTKFLIRALAFLLVAAFAVFAAIENTERIRLSLLGHETPELSVYWWLFMVLFIGVLLGRLTRMTGK